MHQELAALVDDYLRPDITCGKLLRRGGPVNHPAPLAARQQVAVGNRELELVKWNDKLRKAVDDCIVHLSKKVGLALKKLLQDLHNYLLVSWDDSTCSGLSHCMLHKSVLQVALKCTESDTTACLGQFLTLGAKASSWCGSSNLLMILKQFKRKSTIVHA
ncbi:uncharacterized protein LOC124646479 isoform X2 [Lolium rigidum]|uniref:uncharacterized protein LOC124646479 isoform X2 n=1 Tax=Lolium rigidum TaxID=89674 RepID=UPI001F5C85CA|nr:uncharacterized protein LOC124646479 isoform X2 [Lolium rigidum]